MKSLVTPDWVSRRLLGAQVKHCLSRVAAESRERALAGGGWSREHERSLPLAESVQTRQDLGVLVPFQAYTADQKLLVDLTHHGTWDAGSLTGHPRPLTWEAGCRRPCTLLQQARKVKRKTHDHPLCTPILGSSTLNTEDDVSDLKENNQSQLSLLQK